MFTELSIKDSLLCVTICVTEGYNVALTAQARSVCSNLLDATKGHIIFATDKEETVAAAAKIYREILPDFEIHTIQDRYADHPKNYKEDAQLTIAQMRTAVLAKAKALRADLVWSLDADVLPPPNAYRCMLNALNFDAGFYSVATCPYISQGGGGLLFGRGTIQRQIAENFADEERLMPEELKERIAAHKAELVARTPASMEWQERMKDLNTEIEKCPPVGNVFELNGKRWRKRGWGEWAYPAIGKGAIVPSDWCGWGCTLINREALALADFTGYEGRGTEDLFVIWNKWYPAGLRIAAIPHCLCHHVVRKRGKEGYVLVYAYHETEGEAAGHIRVKQVPWYAQDAGERFDSANDGKLE
jgi:hypothetical protein